MAKEYFLVAKTNFDSTRHNTTKMSMFISCSSNMKTKIPIFDSFEEKEVYINSSI